MNFLIKNILAGLIILAAICLLALAKMSAPAHDVISGMAGAASAYLFGTSRDRIVSLMGGRRK